MMIEILHQIDLLFAFTGSFVFIVLQFIDELETVLWDDCEIYEESKEE